LSGGDGSQESVQRHNPLDAHALAVSLADMHKSVFDDEPRWLRNVSCNVESGHFTASSLATPERFESAFGLLNAAVTEIINDILSATTSRLVAPEWHSPQVPLQGFRVP
jgi:hypothetical protein